MMVMLLAAMISTALRADDQSRIQYVKPLVGTAGYGNVYPELRFLSEASRSVLIPTGISMMQLQDTNMTILHFWVSLSLISAVPEFRIWETSSLCPAPVRFTWNLEPTRHRTAVTVQGTATIGNGVHQTIIVLNFRIMA